MGCLKQMLLALVVTTTHHREADMKSWGEIISPCKSSGNVGMMMFTTSILQYITQCCITLHSLLHHG